MSKQRATLANCSYFCSCERNFIISSAQNLNLNSNYICSNTTNTTLPFKSLKLL